MSQTSSWLIADSTRNGLSSFQTPTPKLQAHDVVYLRDKLGVLSFVHYYNDHPDLMMHRDITDHNEQLHASVENKFGWQMGAVPRWVSFRYIFFSLKYHVSIYFLDNDDDGQQQKRTDNYNDKKYLLQRVFSKLSPGSSRVSSLEPREVSLPFFII
jgi:hypothetical protein